MQLLTFIQFTVLCIVQLAIIQYYSAKDVGWNVKLMVLATWTMSIGMILILPIDIYITNLANLNGKQPSDDPLFKILEYWYFFLYYMVFFLTWTVIPVQQSYHESGDIEPKNQLKRAIRLNLYFYLAIGLAGAIFLIIIIKLKIYGDYNLMTFLQALANLWGILLVMLLLGYSVVAIPRSQLRTSDFQNQLNYLYFQAASIQEGQKQAFEKLENVVVDVLELQEQARDFENSDILLYCDRSLEKVPPEIQQYAKEVYLAQQRKDIQNAGGVDHYSKNSDDTKKKVAQPAKSNTDNVKGSKVKKDGKSEKNYEGQKESCNQLVQTTNDQAKPKNKQNRQKSDNIDIQQQEAAVYEEISEQRQEEVSQTQKLLNMISKQKPKAPPKHDIEYAISLRYNVKFYLADTKRARWEWQDHEKKVFQLEDVMSNLENRDQIITSDLRPKQIDGCFQQYLANLEWYWLCLVKNKIKYFLAGFLGALSWLVVFEETVLFLKPEMSIMKELILWDHSLIWIQIVTLIPLGYIIYGVHYGLFRIKISGFYGLYPNHHSDASSLLFTTINFSRVSAPLCFNFLNILGINNCAFNSVLGKVDLMPLFGGSLNQILPGILILISAFNYFDVYDRIMALFGLGNFIFAQKYDQSLIQEGQILMQKAREKQLWQKGGVNIELTYQRERMSKLLSVAEGYEPN